MAYANDPLTHAQGKRGPVHLSTSLLLFTSLARRGQAGSNGLLLWIAFLHHLFDVRRNRFLGATFFEGHDYSPFILVVYFLPRQVNCLAPEVRADLNAWSNDFLLKEAWVVLGAGPCLGL